MEERRGTVTEVAVRLSTELGRPVGPREITALIYDRRIPIEFAPLVAGRRMLCEKAVERVAAILKARDDAEGGADAH